MIEQTGEQQKRQSGFTLFEIAIVMVVIGLLIGGVLIGQNLVESAEIKGVMKQVSHYDSSIENFQARYNKLPGDTSQFNGIGNNNYRIEDDSGTEGLGATFTGEVAYFWEDMGLSGTLVYANANSALEREKIQTANARDLAKLETAAATAFTHTITGNIKTDGPSINVPAVDIGVDGTGIIATNDNMPLSDANSWRNRGLNGVYLIGKVTGITAADPSIAPDHIGDAFTPPLLSIIDVKFDDGVGNTGKIQASSVAGNCLVSGEYDQSNDDVACSAAITYLLKHAEIHATSDAQDNGGGGACGDGVVDAGEQCDDGGTTAGDGCDASCQTETCGFSDPGGCSLTAGTWDPCGNTCNCAGGLIWDETLCTASPYCGNGYISTNEECDDGNTTSGDGCNAGCQIETAVCGDGIIEGNDGEECDDGNTTADDGCGPTCRAEYCGDGIVNQNGAEECDDGNADSYDGCAPSCQSEVCGNGRYDAGEQCDDGNTSGGDNCTSACQNPVCGDGDISLTIGENCDDSNTTAGDGCSATCAEEFCGDGTVNDSGFEQCDDSNNNNGDGCDASCQTEMAPSCGDASCNGGETPYDRRDTSGCPSDCGYVCGDGTCDSSAEYGGTAEDTNNCPADCVAAPVCGNSVVESGEQCDDGNTNSGDGCNSSCQGECNNTCGHGGPNTYPDCICNCDPGWSGGDCNTQDPVCGDGNVDSGEQCDDGNTSDGDNTCTSVCTNPVCGDGYVSSNDQCDDGNGSAGDGCSDCVIEGCGNGRVESGEECDDGDAQGNDGCGPTCLGEYCGDSIVNNGSIEFCDDGNTNSGDGCDSSCHIEVPCGDGMVQGGETCDDGNATGGDGCDSNCQLE